MLENVISSMWDIPIYIYIYILLLPARRVCFLFEDSGLKIGAPKFVLLLLEILVPYRKMSSFICI